MFTSETIELQSENNSLRASNAIAIGCLAPLYIVQATFQLNVEAHVTSRLVDE